MHTRLDRICFTTPFWGGFFLKEKRLNVYVHSVFDTAFIQEFGKCFDVQVITIDTV